MFCFGEMLIQLNLKSTEIWHPGKNCQACSLRNVLLTELSCVTLFGKYAPPPPSGKGPCLLYGLKSSCLVRWTLQGLHVHPCGYMCVHCWTIWPLFLLMSGIFHSAPPPPFRTIKWFLKVDYEYYKICQKSELNISPIEYSYFSICLFDCMNLYNNYWSYLHVNLRGSWFLNRSH